MSSFQNESSIRDGVEAIKQHAEVLPNTPGVYRMIAGNGEVLYVGKAKALKKRVSSYLQIEKLPIRLQRMIALTRRMEFVHTATEVEALLLESNLIKKLKPRYNVLLRDDKSFPYILITGDHDYPQIVKYRGSRKRKGEYFGPFASAGHVNRTVGVIQRAFKLRNCPDTVFATRLRPCLQYHIKRCTAPCVNYVSKEEYARQVDQARAFMSGHSREIQKEFTEKMQALSRAHRYEEAAEYRDRIKALNSIQAHQDVNIRGLKDADILGLYREQGQSCIQVFFFRGGQNYGNYAYYPRHTGEETPAIILGAFMAQFYETKPVPGEILVSHDPAEKDLLEEALAVKSKSSVRIFRPRRGRKLRLVEFAVENAGQALQRHLNESASQIKILDRIKELFGMDERPGRIEVYDNSHISGTHMVGAMIVAGTKGFDKKAYRKFNVKRADASDDYGMMREVLERRFKKALEAGVEVSSEEWPDLILIDGGQGQLNTAQAVLEECGISEEVTLVAIAKGQERNAGREKLYMSGRKPFQLPRRDPALHYLQRLRDEAHRFAVYSHRVRRQKAIHKSLLDEIPGVGSKRKKALLQYFGSARAVTESGIEDLAKVNGISRAMAETIYEHFREQ